MRPKTNDQGPKPIYQVRAKVIKNIEVAPKYSKMVIHSPNIARRALPGQFVNIRVSQKYEPLLRRPFSIHDVDGKNIVILYEVIGKGTQILRAKKKGEFIDILGPLGRGFQLHTVGHDLDMFLVAGGMGVAPLVYLARHMPTFKKVVLLGAKNKNHILCKKDFIDLGCEVQVATDDGSAGFKGTATELLRKNLNSKKVREFSSIFACGPAAMLKEIAKISKKYKMPAEISLEEHMACGIGACFGCAVQTKYGYKRVCKEGPVFEADYIKF